MKIRKYEGQSETEAMLKVKEELGKEALIVSVKNIKPKGIYRLFKKPYVEVTAAVDDRSILDDGDREPTIPRRKRGGLEAVKMQKEASEGEDELILARFKEIVEHIPKDQFKSSEATKVSQAEADKKPNLPTQDSRVDQGEGLGTDDVEIVNATLIKAIYDQLIDNEVREDIVNQLTSGLEQLKNHNDEEVLDVISVVYKRIVNMLADYETIRPEYPNTVFFVGPTGVGKTTTIAKVASYYTLNLGKKVALITSDTYRIAAVEQLRTYANILNIPIKVVYSKEELTEAVNHFSQMDLVLVDTAGRSHKNAVHQQDLKDLVDVVHQKEIYLVLSVATKYKDLMMITKTYEEIGPYKLVFTKLDETDSYGNILNVKAETGAKLSYVTFGQNVPDDISDVNPHEIARQVLGGNA